MQTINYKSKNFARELEVLYRRPSYPAEIEAGVKEILAGVKNEGDRAVVRYAHQFDHATLKAGHFAVTPEELKAATAQVDAKARRAINNALAHITAFAKQRIPQPWSFQPRAGVTLGERFEPMQRVGVYIPGGTAPLVSTVLHTAGIAKAAGVKEIVLVTPPGPDGRVNPCILYAAQKAGVKEIYRLGGVYAVAALAYGTESIRKVDKIVGPGNAYVTAAKKLVYGEVALDMVAGPSEIMIVADDLNDAACIAADMLSQAEHGSGHEQAVLVTTNPKLGKAVQKEVERQSKELSRSAAVAKVMDRGMFIIEVKDMTQAAEVAGAYAPEHLELICQGAAALAKKIRAAGAIFIGRWTPEPVGDFVAGPSHVLPTAGSARFFTGLTVEGFFRRMSTVQYDRHALADELPDILQFARMEGLDAHGNSAAIRMATQPTDKKSKKQKKS